MKRLHVHLSVGNLDKSIAFYSSLFQTEPVVVKDDYAKWMLEDPRINFAISMRGAEAGLEHLGIQVDTEAELAIQRSAISKAELGAYDEGETTCCYAQSDKSWVKDPDGHPWEVYMTMGEVKYFSSNQPTSEAASCCPTQGCC